MTSYVRHLETILPHYNINMDMKPKNYGSDNYETEWYWDVSGCQRNNPFVSGESGRDASKQESDDGEKGTRPIEKKSSGARSETLSLTGSECRHDRLGSSNGVISMINAEFDPEEECNKSDSETNCITLCRWKPNLRVSEDHSTCFSAQSSQCYSDEGTMLFA